MGGGVQHLQALSCVFRALVCLAVLTPFMAMPRAWAGAWTQQAGKGLLISSASHHRFDLPDAGYGYSKFETALYLEYGLTERMTLLGRLARETRFHQAPSSTGKSGSRAVLSVQTVSAALGDSEIGLRRRLASGANLTVSAQTALVRFSAEPNPLLNAEARWGADMRLQAGRSLGQAVFIDAQLGRRSDWRGDRHETRLDLTLGLRPRGRWLIMAQTYSAWGEAGWSAYRRPYESHRLHLSVTAPVSERLSLQIGATNSAYSDSLAPESAYMVSVWREF